jgi:hypothetical protein
MILRAVTGRRVGLLAVAAFVVASDATLVAAAPPDREHAR